MKNTDKYQDLLEILAKMGEEQMEQSQWDTLSAKLSQDPELREFYVRYIYTDAQLGRYYGTTRNLNDNNDLSSPLMDVIESILSEQTVSKFDAETQAEKHENTSTRFDTSVIKTPTRRNNLIIPPAIAYGTIAAMIALVIFIAMPEQTKQVTVFDDKPVATPLKIATLEKMVGDITLNNMPLSNGQSLLTGDYHINKGVAVIRWESGVDTIIEGPARFNLVSDQLIDLKQGRILAHVPNGAHGFTVKTPTSTTVDLGTDFGVDVNKEQQTEVHVIKGLVEFNDTHTIEDAISVDIRKLKGGQAVRMNKLSLWVTPIESKSILFLNKIDVDILALAARGDKDAQYQAMMRDLRRKPGLLAATTITPLKNNLIDGFGFKENATWRRPDKENDTFPIYSKNSLTNQNTKSFGTKLTLADKNGRQDVFADLDTSPIGNFAKMGLLNSDGLIGKDNTTLYISWLTQASDFTPSGFAGLAFFAGGDESGIDEMLFVGKVSDLPTYSFTKYRKKAGDPVINNSENYAVHLDRNTATQRLEKKYIDPNIHRWVIRIDFRKGYDKIQFYIDPENNQSIKANGIIESMDLSFDRLRMSSGGGAGTWDFDEIRIGTSLEAVTNTITK